MYTANITITGKLQRLHFVAVKLFLL